MNKDAGMDGKARLLRNMGVHLTRASGRGSSNGGRGMARSVLGMGWRERLSSDPHFSYLSLHPERVVVSVNRRHFYAASKRLH